MISLKCTGPGFFEYDEIPSPTLHPGNAIIKIKRIGICGTDLHAFKGTQPFFDYPRILGHELSGELTDLAGACEFRPGDPVTLIPYFHCGNCIAYRSGKPNCCVNMKVFGVHVDGGFSEFISVPITALVHGASLGYEALALVEPLSIGAHGIRRAEVKKDDFVLVIGAGPIGLSAMKFAQLAGAEVIALDQREQRLAWCRDRFGIRHTIHAGDADVLQQIARITCNDMPAIVIDATGNLEGINNGFKYISHGGKYILIGLQKADINFSHPEFHKREASLLSSRNATREDFTHVVDCLRNGQISPGDFVNHHLTFESVKNEFPGLYDENRGIVKTMVNFL